MTEQTVNYETGEIVPTAQDPQAQAGLFAKLARAMGSLNRLPKSGRNEHFNYDFVTDGDVSDAVRRALAAENVAFLASMRGTRQDGKKTNAYFTFTFGDGETGTTWSCEWEGEATDSQDKGIAKAATSALKYFLLKTFILSAGDPVDDPDADGPAPAPKQAKKAPAPAPANQTKKVQAPSEPETNGTEEVSKAAFYAGILKDIPYYRNIKEVTAALQTAGFTGYKQAKEAEMRKALQAHANQAANKEAA